eukprot:3521817-Pleurochrysis_carterae.AAC.1
MQDSGVDEVEVPEDRSNPEVADLGSTAGGDEAAGGGATESAFSSSEPGGEGGAEGGALAPARVAMGLSSSLLVLRGSENSSSLEGPADGALGQERGKTQLVGKPTLIHLHLHQT